MGDKQSPVEGEGYHREISRFIFDLVYFALQLYALIWQACYDENTFYKNPFAVGTSGYIKSTRLICVFAGCLSAPIVLTIFELLTWRPAVQMSRHFTLAKLFTAPERNRRVLNEVSMPDGADPSGGKVNMIRWSKGHLFFERAQRTRLRMRNAAVSTTFVSTLFFVQMMWTLIGTINAGWWWRYTDISSSATNVFGEPRCVGSNCTLYYLLWNNAHVPNTMRCVDLFFLGCMWMFNTFTTLTNTSTRKMFSEPMFWINQSVLPFVTMVGSVILHWIAEADLSDVGTARNTVNFFHPLRWISLGQFLNWWLTDAQALSLAKGNEYRAAVIKSASKIVVLLMCFCFSFYLFEVDPAGEWNITKNHLDLNGDFDQAQIGHFHWGMLTSFYITVVTCSTIGYGDYSPSTTIGYLVTIIFIILSISSLMALFGELGDAKKFGIVEGTVPTSRQLKDTVVIVGPVDGKNLDRFLANLHCSNNLQTSGSAVSHLICIIPPHKHSECRQVLKKASDFGMRYCLIKGDIAFGSVNRAVIFSRLDIANWSTIRDIIVVGDKASTGDVVREARMTISRIEALRRYIPNQALGINHLTTTTYNSLEKNILAMHAKGNLRVESTLKAASIAKSVLYTPGVHVLISALFSLDTYINHGGMMSLLTRNYKESTGELNEDGTEATKCLSDTELMQRGIQHNIMILETTDYMTGMHYQVLTSALYDVFRIIVIGIHNTDLETNMISGEQWDYWINPNGSSKKILITEKDRLIVICNPFSYQLWCSYTINHVEAFRKALAFHVERFRIGNYRYNPSDYELQVMDHRDDQRTEEFEFAMAPEYMNRSLRSQFRMKEDVSDWEDAAEYYHDPSRNVVVIFGTGSAWEELVRLLVIEAETQKFNILHVVDGPLPDLHNIFCENLNFNWSKPKNYWVCHSLTSDHLLTFSRVQLNNPRVKEVIFFPGHLHNEDRDELQDDVHVYATIDRLQQYFTAFNVTKPPRIFFNIENSSNLDFFTGIRGLQREGQWVKQYKAQASIEPAPGDTGSKSRVLGVPSIIGGRSQSRVTDGKMKWGSKKEVSFHKKLAEEGTLAYPYRILTSSVVHGGQCFVDGMTNFMAYNNNIADCLVFTDVAYNLLGIRTDTNTRTGQLLHETPMLKEGIKIAPLPKEMTFMQCFEYFSSTTGEIPIGVRRLKYGSEELPHNRFVLVAPPGDLDLWPGLDEIYLLSKSRVHRKKKCAIHRLSSMDEEESTGFENSPGRSQLRYSSD